MGDWSFADAWECVADVLPDAPAQVHGAMPSSSRPIGRSPAG